VITEYRQVVRVCSHGHETVGALPAGVAANSGAIQIGPNTSSFLVYLNSAHHIPYGRLTQISRDIFHFSLSEGTLDNKLEIAAIAAISLGDSILHFLHASSWTGSDETGVRVAGKRIWQWVWQNAKASLYAISSHRDYQTVKDTFGESYVGTMIHDCYSAQNNTKALWHQLCHAHLLRDLQFIIDLYQGNGCNSGAMWAYKMQILLLRSQRARDHIWKDSFNSQLRDKIVANYNNQLSQLLAISLVGKDAIRLQKRFIKHESKILHFMSSQDIPPDNNGSERAIRNCKTKQKVSGGYRSQHGADRQAAILSVIETAKKQELNVLEVIRKLIVGETVVLFGGE
jgi:hypothetical protein